MKTFIKTILQTALFATLLLGMGTFADASSFYSNPFVDGKGVTTVSNDPGTYDDYNSISLEDDEFYVYIAYQNREAVDIFGVEARIDFPTSGDEDAITITGKLNASGSSVHSDNAYVSGLPDEWELEMISAQIFNNHGAPGHPDVGVCVPNPYYDYNVSVPTGLLSNSWYSMISGAAVLDTLGTDDDTGYTGMCDQGHVIAKFRVEDVSEDDVIIDEPDELFLATEDATAVTATTAHLNGEVLSGSVNDPYFVYASGPFVSCGVPDGVDYGYFDEGDSIDYDIMGGLTPDTFYTFRVCGVGDDGLVSGYPYHFTTLSEVVDEEEDDVIPDATTYAATGVGDSYAVLHGNVDMNDFDDGYVFFVYGEDYTAVDNSEFAGSYAAITPDGDDLATVVVHTSFDGDDNFSQTVGGFNSSTDHYYRICVQYNDGGFDLECGAVVEFVTTGDVDDGGGDDDDDDGSEEDPDATTYSADEVDEDSAELNGYIDMNDFDNGDVFFVWGENEDDIDDAEYADSYSDIDEDGDNIRTEMVDTDLDDADSYYLDVHGLDENEDYYFRICVDYYDDGDQMVCGNVKHFDTDSDDDDDDDDEAEIETRDVEVGSTRADMCGDLIDDGGDDNMKTWIEYRRSTSGTFSKTTKIDRGEGDYCVTVTSLDPGTDYRYRACSEDSCGDTKTFTTVGELPSGAIAKPLVSTDTPTNIRSNSAVLNGFYVSNADSLNVWFNYGRTPALGNQTRTYDKFGANGSMSHNFTNLAANTTYYYQAVARNAKGTVVGNILSFKTGGGTGSVVVVERVEEETIDLAKLGLGLSLVRLEIDDDREQVVRGENIEYLVSWENISTLDLTDIDLKVTLPEEVEITNTSRGIFDADQNAIFYTIDDLDDGEDGELTVFGTVTGGTLGSALTAEATIAFDNPVNDAQENATDYDIDELVVRSNFGTASVFGLSNISFLGWLVILLGLLIIFLVARWLYLEREELRAQAYAGGYGRPAPAPAYNYAPPVQQATPQQPVYQAPAPTYQAPVAPQAPAPAPTTPEYEPYTTYRPNR